MFACGIQNLGNFSCGIQNPGLWKLEFSSRNPESRTVLDYLTRGNLIEKPTSQCQSEASMLTTWSLLIPLSEEKDKFKKGVTSVTKGQGTGKICLLYWRFIVSRFFWNYKFYYYWGKVNCSLNWGLHYIEVRYVEVSLYNYCTNLRSLYSLVFNFLFTFSVSMPGASRQSWSPSKRGVTWDITGCK